MAGRKNLNLGQYERAIDYARHEVGHLVVAKLLGFPTGAITLKEEQGGSEITLQPSLGNLATTKSYIERRIQVLYAGVLAQSIRASKANPEVGNALFETTARDDFSKIRELLRMHVGMERANAEVEDFQEKMDNTNERFYRKAVKLVNDNASAINEVAEIFVREMALAGNPQQFTLAKAKIDEVCQKLDLSRDE